MEKHLIANKHCTRNCATCEDRIFCAETLFSPASVRDVVTMCPSEVQPSHFAPRAIPAFASNR